MTARAVACWAAVALLGGCYSVGFQPEGGGGTLAVPMFENRTLRRDLELSLTRHVRREVLETTPLHLAPEGGLGERVLKGAIVSVSENVVVAGPAEEVLESSLRISVSFGVWREGRLVLGEDQDADGTPEREAVVEGYADFAPSRGQTRDQAAEEVLRDLAEMIVARLAERSDDRWEPNDEPARAVALPLGRHVALRQRDADWFRIVVPPDQALEVTLAFSGPEDLVLRAASSDGEWLPDALGSDGGRLLRVPALTGERTVLLRVSGPDDGREYGLNLRLR